MTSKNDPNNPVFLWSDQAPGSQGESPEDKPHLISYLVESATPAPAVIIFPGGGYAHRADHEGKPVAAWLNSLGISALVLNYRVAPYRHPCPLQDAQRAVRLARSRATDWGVDPQRLGVLGFSAGGHLAATLSTHFDQGVKTASDPVDRQSCRPDFAVLCYPVITLLGDHRHAGSMRNLLGESPNEATVRDLSAESQVSFDTPPTFLWHTADDAGVPVENSLLYASALRRHEVPFALHIFPHGRHGLGLATGDPEVEAWTGLCGQWLARQIRLKH